MVTKMLSLRCLYFFPVQVLSIISAINAGILFLIQIVTIFGVEPGYGNNNCYCPPVDKQNVTQSNVTLPPPVDNYCCQHDENNNSPDFGPDNVIYLLVGLTISFLF